MLENLSGVDCMAVNPHTQSPERVVDPYLPEVRAWGYQSCQPHQKAIIDAAAGIHQLSATNTVRIDNNELNAQEQAVVEAITGLLATVDSSKQSHLLHQIQNNYCK